MDHGTPADQHLQACMQLQARGVSTEMSRVYTAIERQDTGTTKKDTQGKSTRNQQSNPTCNQPQVTTTHLPQPGLLNNNSNSQPIHVFDSQLTKTSNNTKYNIIQ